MVASNRRSPSGPTVAGDRLRWYGDDPNDTASSVVGTFSRFGKRAQAGVSNFSETEDPVEELEELQGSYYVVLPGDYRLIELGVARAKNDPETTLPAGDGNIVIAVLSFEVAEDGSIVQKTLAEVEYAPAELGFKTVAVDSVVPAGAYIACLATFPTNWVLNDGTVWQVTLDV